MIFLVIAFILVVLPEEIGDSAANLARETVLRPVFAIQRGAIEREVRFGDAERLRAERDSLAAVLVGSAALQAENRQLRDLIGIGERLPYQFVPVEVLHVHGRGFDGGFLLTAGRDDGVVPGSPIVSGGGLVGMIRNVGARGSVGMDWTHPDFRASGMTMDGDTYGMIQPYMGRGGERLLLMTGTPFHSDLSEGTLIVTSGRAVYPRGIPIGRILGPYRDEGTWRRSYLVEPAVTLAEMNQVLVLGEPSEEAFGQDLAGAWGVRPELPGRPADPTDPTRAPEATAPGVGPVQTDPALTPPEPDAPPPAAPQPAGPRVLGEPVQPPPDDGGR